MTSLMDTSIAIPYLIPDHPWHAEVVARLGYQGLGLAGHAAFETLSVLTRLPGELRITAPTAARMLEHNFPRTHYLSADSTAAALSAIGRAGISGALVYDALVGYAAVAAGATLLTADRKAAPAYAAVGASVEFLIESSS